MRKNLSFLTGKADLMGSQPKVCVLPIYAGHASKFPSACTATPLAQPNEIKMCCPADVLLSAEASSVWENGKAGIYVRVQQMEDSTFYVGDRGHVKGGAFVAELDKPACGCGKMH